MRLLIIKKVKIFNLVFLFGIRKRNNDNRITTVEPNPETQNIIIIRIPRVSNNSSIKFFFLS